jgi:hypothetical protein
VVTKVLVVVGSARCGSTVLGATLGGVDGVVNVGELKNLWSICLARPGFPCGCGEPVSSCPFWSEVLGTAGLAGVPVAEMVAREKADIRLGRVRRGGSGTAAAGFVGAITAVIEAIATVSSADLVVDTSKWPPYAAAIAADRRLAVSAAHLVRDPRGAVVSVHRGWHGELGLDHPLDRKQAARVVLSWHKTNTLAELLVGRHRRLAVRLRYEDFVAAPRPAADRLLALAGHVALPTNIDDRTVTLGVQHALAGSRTDRVRTVTTMSADDVWRSFLSPTTQRALYAAGLPLTWRYGYPLTATQAA